MLKNKRDDIMDVAERMIRMGGFHGFSFRDIAHEIGIKSASVHYHFPTKADLGSAVAKRYAEQLIAALPEPESFEGQKAEVAAQFLRQGFQASLEREGLICLCAVLSAEAAGIPENVALKSREFFLEVCAWLIKAFSFSSDLCKTSEEDRETMALTVISRLEGAMILAKGIEDQSAFMRLTSQLI